jgi:diguanylate cyclase (GGDEF)-like protein
MARPAFRRPANHCFVMTAKAQERSVLSPATWTDAGITLGVSLFLALAAVLYIFAERDAEPALGVFAMALVGFLGATLFLISSTRTRMISELIVGCCCLLMLAFIAIFSVTIGGPDAFVLALLCLPVCYAGLNGNPLGTGVIILAATCLWALLNLSAWWPEASALARVALSCLPLLFVGALVNLLSREIDRARFTLDTLKDRDELTGVLNRDALMRCLVAEHQQAAARQASYALLFIDIDQLESINAQHGREAGDKTLVAVAETLTRCIRDAGRVGRLETDQFVIVLPGADDKTAGEMTNRVRQNIYNMTLQFTQRAQRIQVSVGIAIFPESGQSISQMLKYAKQSMLRDRGFRQQQKTNANQREQGSTAGA